MPRTLILELTAEQKRELLLIRDRAEKPYLRERAAALLKIAEGARGVDVAESGLLRPRARQTISEWAARYREQGVEGLEIRTGRGRKPAFSPTAQLRAKGPGRVAASGRTRS
jgi:hypothetical protein